MKPERVLLLAAVAIAASACSKNAPAGAAAPMSPAADAAYADDMAGEALEYEAQEPATLEELQAQFEKLDADLSAVGIPEDADAPEPASTKTASKDDGERCERICGLETAICDVSERICSLAEEHVGEEKYADACTRSEARCEQATQACDRCS